MVDLGVVTLGVFTDEGVAPPIPAEDTTDQNQHIVVFKVTTPRGTVGVCVHRGQLNWLLAHPNQDAAVKCSIMMEGAYGISESQ